MPARSLNATDPDLRVPRARGGKLLMYFGWADTALPPMMGIDYYEKAVAANGAGTPRLLPPVHGARHVPLPRRRRAGAGSTG